MNPGNRLPKSTANLQQFLQSAKPHPPLPHLSQSSHIFPILPILPLPFPNKKAVLASRSERLLPQVFSGAGFSLTLTNNLRGRRYPSRRFFVTGGVTAGQSRHIWSREVRLSGSPPCLPCHPDGVCKAREQAVPSRARLRWCSIRQVHCLHQSRQRYPPHSTRHCWG